MYVSIGASDSRGNIRDVFLLRADSEEAALQKIVELIETTAIDMRAVEVFTYDIEYSIQKKITVYTKDKKDKLHFIVRTKDFPSLAVMPDKPDEKIFSPLDIYFYNKYNELVGGQLEAIAVEEEKSCH